MKDLSMEVKNSLKELTRSRKPSKAHHAMVNQMSPLSNVFESFLTDPGELFKALGESQKVWHTYIVKLTVK